MKKLCILAITALFSLLAQNSLAQNVVLINGQASEVVLSGSDIEEIVNHKITDYLADYGHEPNKDFKHVSLKTKEQIVDESISESELFENKAFQLITLATDRPQVDIDKFQE